MHDTRPTGAASPADLLSPVMTEVRAALRAQREALMSGDLDAVEASAEALHAPLGRLRQLLPRPGAPAPALSPALREALRAARACAESNDQILRRLAAPARARLDHLAAAAPRLESARAESLYAPAGAFEAGLPRPQALGQA